VDALCSEILSPISSSILFTLNLNNKLIIKKIVNAEIKQKLGQPNLARSDGSVHMMRYDSSSCRLFIFFNINSNIKRVEYFEFRDSLGELINTKNSIEECYKEYDFTS